MFESIIKKVNDQLAKPHGTAGKVFTAMQNVGNFKSYRYVVGRIEPSDTVLDIGFGNGKLMHDVLSAKHLKTICGIDIAEDMLVYVSKKYRRQIADGTMDFRQEDIGKPALPTALSARFIPSTRSISGVI